MALLLLAPLATSWVAAPGGGVLRAHEPAQRSVSPRACDGGEAAVRRLQQELSQAKRDAADATNAEARLRNMVRSANQNAERLAQEKFAAEAILKHVDLKKTSH